MRLERIFGRSHSVELTLRTLAFTLEGDHTIAHKTPFLVKEEKASFTVQLGSKDECSRVANAIRQKINIDKVLNVRIKTCPISLASFISVETNGS